MATQPKKKPSIDLSDIFDVVDESRLGKGAKVGKKKISKKKTSKKKKLKIKKMIGGPLGSLSGYGK